MLLLLAFWQEDVTFLTDVTLMLTGEDQRADIDLSKFQAEVGEVMTKARHSSLSEIQLGPILQEVTEIAIRHDVPLPASMALTAKALAQMQLATAELDPDLDPFAVAGSFLARNLMSRIGESTDPPVRRRRLVPRPEPDVAHRRVDRPAAHLLRDAEVPGPADAHGRGRRAGN